MAFLKHKITLVLSLWTSLICVALMTPPLGAVAPKKSLYAWKTGVWGVCVANDCGSVGLQNRSVWCIHSEGWSTHQSNCFPSERPPHQRVCVKMCEWQKDLFEWRWSPWASCTPTPFLPANRCVTAQRGVQSRDVVCVKRTNSTTVSPHMCETFSPAPEREQACLLPCPIDCVVSAFSHWSTCSRTCGSALQQRTRRVMATPLFGGADCPSLTQTRPCNHDNTHPALCPSDQQEYSYSLWVGPWSPCRLKGKTPSGKTTVDFSFGLDGIKAGKASYFVKRHTESIHHQNHYDDKRGHKALWEITVGYQTRQLRCTRSDGKNSMLSLCDHDNSPVNFRSCVMPRDCKVSDWSTWSPCSKTCRVSDQSPGFRSRYRSLKRAAIGGGDPCPALEETQRCNVLEDKLPLCPRYDWRLTKWNRCQVTPLLSQQDHRHSNSSVLCGGGIQTREAYCVRIHNNTAPSHINRPVERNLCTGPLPPLAQSCSIPCQTNCPLTPWSPWGLCLHDNCLEPQGKRGFRLRTRSVITDSWVESHSCPHITEAMICDDPICFLWKVTSQGPCVPQNGSCGAGTQEQTVECFSVTGESAPSERCPGDPPPAQQPCEMACPGDCVLGAWGSWSPCSQSCSSKHLEGKQTRSRPVLALPGAQGKPCSPASELEQWRPCGTHPCTVYYWHTSPWDPCVPDSITDGGERNSSGQMENEAACGTGGQVRQVTCRKAGNGHVVPKRCPESSRPESIRSCALPCKIDCVVTPFSEWSPCPTSCLPANTTASIQYRHRIITQRPANGGQECPDTLYEERECDPPPLCPVYRWQTHRWHQCILVPDSVRQAVGGPTEACGIGLELREVTCVGADDASADMADCVRWAGVMPAQVKECRVPCRNECTFTSWSRFTQCQGCGSWRTRNRSLIGRSKKRWHCQQQELFPVQEKEACPCSEFHTQPQGPWSPCLLPLTNQAGHPFLQGVYQQGQKAFQDCRAQRKHSECGPGKRYRALACLDHQGRLVEPALCSSSGYEEEVCHVPCSTDCKLSEWSNWSTCSASCGGGVKVRSQWLREKPFNGGRPCPQLNYKNQAQVSEVLHCYSKCSQYMWAVTSWSMCIINPTNTNNTTTPAQPVCGEGFRTCKIRCVKKGGQNLDESVDDSLCDQEEQPITAETCLLPCPTHCVTSEWSQWTKCTVDCNDGDLRWRSRTVLRWPEGDHTCPDLNQTQPCNNVTCLKYSYVYSDWSSCQLGENAVCGKGLKTRLLNCVRSDGKLVELSMCTELGPSRGKLSAPCEVGCPVNCLLTEWSTWSECSHTCGSQSQMTRSRIVLQSAGEGGRPCPSQLSQTRSCPIRPCYSWRLGDWSPCRVEGADCGEGVSRREMSCVVHWGSLSGPPQPIPVEDQWCVINSQSKVEIELRQPCTVPCPGECHLTKWSPWSSCQLLCLDGRSFETWGRQARSRAVVTQVAENQDTCPSQVYETQPCQGGTCLSYEWMTGEWRHNRRLVWCRRSDGVNVTGGCITHNRPSAIRQCHPPCTKPFSFCTQSGVCGCEKGFTEVMTSHGFLDYCTRAPGLDHKKADVKTSVGHLRPEHARNKNQIKDWALQPLRPDGRVKLWVYGLMAGGFILILLLIVMSFLLCKNHEDSPSSSPQKAMALAYDGDVDI